MSCVCLLYCYLGGNSCHDQDALLVVGPEPAVGGSVVLGWTRIATEHPWQLISLSANHILPGALEHIHAESATASVAVDLESIRNLIQGYPGGFDTLNTTVKQRLDQWFQSQGGIKHRSAHAIHTARLLPSSTLTSRKKGDSMGSSAPAGPAAVPTPPTNLPAFAELPAQPETTVISPTTTQQSIV